MHGSHDPSWDNRQSRLWWHPYIQWCWWSLGKDINRRFQRFTAKDYRAPLVHSWNKIQCASSTTWVRSTICTEGVLLSAQLVLYGPESRFVAYLDCPFQVLAHACHGMYVTWSKYSSYKQKAVKTPFCRKSSASRYQYDLQYTDDGKAQRCEGKSYLVYSHVCTNNDDIPLIAVCLHSGS